MPKFTVDQYLVIERESEERHLYLDGEIYAMAGESEHHADISANVFGLLHSQLRGSPCRARIKGTKVRSGPTPMSGKSTKGMFSYPDIVVICDEREFHDAHKDIVLNPTAIVEVLSPSTEAFDRGEQFTRFQTWNRTLSDYLLVSQDRPQIEHYCKKPDDGWDYARHTDMDPIVTIASIKCKLTLSEVYERVVFKNE
jgi:Uma2 family endonuclease